MRVFLQKSERLRDSDFMPDTKRLLQVQLWMSLQQRLTNLNCLCMASTLREPPSVASKLPHPAAKCKAFSPSSVSHSSRLSGKPQDVEGQSLALWRVTEITKHFQERCSLGLKGFER